jgi:hypothetical protein
MWDQVTSPLRCWLTAACIDSLHDASFRWIGAVYGKWERILLVSRITRPFRSLSSASKSTLTLYGSRPSLSSLAHLPAGLPRGPSTSSRSAFAMQSVKTLRLVHLLPSNALSSSRSCPMSYTDSTSISNRARKSAFSDAQVRTSVSPNLDIF